MRVLQLNEARRAEINWGTLIAAVGLLIVVAGALGAIIGKGWTSANSAEQALRDIVEIKAQISQLQVAVSPVVGQQIHLDNIERWISGNEARRQRDDDAIARLDKNYIELSAHLQSVIDASRVALPGPRR